MADLQNAVGAARQFDQPLAFLHRHGHGLFDQDIRAGVEKILGDLEVQRCRSHDADGIDMTEQFAIVGIGRNAQFGRHRRARLRRRIGDPDQVRVRQARVFLRMKPAQIADADHRRADQGERVSPPLAAGAVILAQLQGGAADDRQRGARKAQQSAPHRPQSGRQRPEHHAPTAQITPTPTKTQGLASYSVCGVQERMCRFYSARSLSEYSSWPGGPAAGFVYNPRPW